MLQSCLHQSRFASSKLGNSTTTTSLAPLCSTLLHFAPLCSTFSLQYSTELTPLLHYPTPLAPQLLSYINSPIFRFGALKLDLLLICIYCCYLVVLLIHSLYVYYSFCQNRGWRDGAIDSGDGKSFGGRLGPSGHLERARKQLRHTGGVSHSQHKSLFAKPKVQDSLPGGVSHSQHKRSKVGNSRRPETTYTSPTNTPTPLRKTPALNRPFQPPPLSPSWPKP